MDNFDFVVFAISSSNDQECFQTGSMVDGLVDSGGWGRIGSCRGRSPQRRQWFNITVKMREGSMARIFMDGSLVETVETRFRGRSRVGVISYNGRADIVYFRPLVVSKASIGDCLSNPCLHNAACIDIDDVFVCACPDGYGGQTCDVIVNPCRQIAQRCNNGAVCMSVGNRSICLCTRGFVGKQCEYPLDACTSVPCLNGGTCVASSTAYRCRCPSGLVGSHCELNENECESRPCENGATCVDLLDGFFCACAQGFTGSRCRVVETCAVMPCFNGGRCVDGTPAYTCLCRPGFSGSRCQVDQRNCGGRPCLNGGVCRLGVSGGTNITCHCPSGFSGRWCEDAVYTSCLSRPCQNGGVCSDGGYFYTCRCPSGFSGTNCQTNAALACASSPCTNRATCEDTTTGDFVCRCAQGYVGLLCRQYVGVCGSYPCVNGATCREVGEGFHCVCRAQFVGVRCENRLNACASRPCENSATCLNEVGGYLCACRHGYGGDRCQTLKDMCVSRPCQNGGSCRDATNAYRCDCPRAYDGSNCERLVDPCGRSPCQRGGRCVVSNTSPTGFLCHCTPGHHGQVCELIITNNLLPLPQQRCGNLGTPIRDVARMTRCLCPPGITGAACDVIEPEYCKAGGCLHGGTCVRLSYWRYMCACKHGYGGLTCEREFNECRSDPCPAGESCTDLVAGYSCTTNGTLGPATVLTATPLTCGHGGTLMSVGDIDRCLCPLGSTGSTCEHPTGGDRCDSDTCLNGGTCQMSDTNVIVCLCPPFYAGERCHLDSDPCAGDPCPGTEVCQPDTYNHLLGYRCVNSIQPPELYTTTQSVSADTFSVVKMTITTLFVGSSMLVVGLLIAAWLRQGDEPGRRVYPVVEPK